MSTYVEKFVGESWSQSETAGGIFSIHDNKINLAILDDVR
jgi:hypothetical protein